MATRAIFLLVISTCFLSKSHAATFTITNNCRFTVWPGVLTGSGQAQPSSSTGFELSPKASTTLSIPAPWSGRFWGRTDCTTDSNGHFKCATADCGSNQVQCNGAGGTPPASLIEFFLAPNNGKDFYDISLVDGFNLPVSITPQGGSGGCNSTGCPANVNDFCPPELALKGSDGKVVACKSACLTFNQPIYCCTGDYSTPDKCPPSSYSEVFKQRCPQAYSYAYDDGTSTFTCVGGANYLITFCP